MDLPETRTAEGTHQHAHVYSGGGTICRRIHAEVHTDVSARRSPCRGRRVSGTQGHTHGGSHRTCARAHTAHTLTCIPARRHV